MSPFIEELEKHVASICRQASFRKIKYIGGMQAMQKLVTKLGLEPSMLPERCSARFAVPRTGRSRSNRLSRVFAVGLHFFWPGSGPQDGPRFWAVLFYGPPICIA